MYIPVTGWGTITFSKSAKVCRLTIVLSLIFIASVTSPAQARWRDDINASLQKSMALYKPTGEIPNTENRSHRVGNVWMTITNWGIFGSQFRASQLVETEGPYAGQPAPSFEYPANTGLNYLFWGGLWIGAVVEQDTLVSTGVVDEGAIHEFYPDAGVEGEIIERSTRPNSPYYSPEAISEQEYIAVYTDTLTDRAYVATDQFLQRPHKPLGLRIKQTSYSWAYDYAQDFVLIDYVISNISDKTIEKPYMGLFVDADCWHKNTGGEGASDDYSGYLRTVPSPYPGLLDTINIAWTSDNDGDPSSGAFDLRSPTGIAGTRVVRGPAQSEGCGPAPLNYSFNWWTQSADSRFDWGPRLQTSVRDFGTGGEGTPRGDLNKYYIMSNGEFDYDQLFSAVDFSAQGWRPPKKDIAGNIADGTDTRYLFSFGPLADLRPGDSTYVTLAYVGGENFHVEPDDFERFFDPQAPWKLYEKFDFSDFATNAQWAAWVFDNPGVDTDGDGCRGLYSFSFCRDTTMTIIPPSPQNQFPDTVYEFDNCDTVWYAGDGVPDFKGPPPPPSPRLEVSTEPTKLTVSWTGEYSEMAVDDFTFKRDFEGYRVYIAESNALVSYSLIASWDVIDYKRFYYNPSTRRWKQTVDPIRLETLYDMYGQDYFDPRDYDSPFSPFVDQHDSAFYFLPQDWNRGNEFIENNRIVKNKVQYVGTDSVYNEESGQWELFGKYECVIENLLMSQPYYVAVTAFDFGNLEKLDPLESSMLGNATPIYATYSPDIADEKNMRVAVYPNPYIISDNYRGRQYEDREQTGWSERDRRIHFTNLPEKATIRIFTLDGDLVRQIDHPDSWLSDTPWHTSWDLITRNTQAVVSGIYLYSVESERGTQIGKIVIIR